MTRYEECLQHVIAYARDLRCNESAVEGLIRSYVDQPAYDATYRPKLIDAALSWWIEQRFLRRVVDKAWQEATESTAVPSTAWADRIIEKAR